MQKSDANLSRMGSSVFTELVKISFWPFKSFPMFACLLHATFVCVHVMWLVCGDHLHMLLVECGFNLNTQDGVYGTYFIVSGGSFSWMPLPTVSSYMRINTLSQIGLCQWSKVCMLCWNTEASVVFSPGSFWLFKYGLVKLKGKRVTDCATIKNFWKNSLSFCKTFKTI